MVDTSLRHRQKRPCAPARRSTGSALVHNCGGSGLKGASDGLVKLFSGGSVQGRSIIGIRSDLVSNGFTQGLAQNKKGYLLTNGTGEQVKIMSRNGSWDIRIRNKSGNYLDSSGNVAMPGQTHGITVGSR